MGRRPILYNGQIYSTPLQKSGGGESKEPKVSYEEARAKVLSNVLKMKEDIGNIPKGLKLPNEVVLSLRLEPEFTAKSYYPGSLFCPDDSQNGFVEIGSRAWKNISSQEEKIEQLGKLFFIRTSDNGLDNFIKELNKKESNLSKKKFALDIRKIHNLSILKPEEQIVGFPINWEEGRIEAVLHPFFTDRNLVLKHFLDILKSAGVAENMVKSKQYGGGITFVSFKADKKVLNRLEGYNPLRTAHPINFNALPLIRGQLTPGIVHPPVFKNKSNIVVGIFDGGIDSNSPYLSQYCENIEAVNVPEESKGIEHGSAVAGVVLYGPLNKYSSKDILPEPKVSVRSFRVLPTSDPADPDLYEVIDAIEALVPLQKDISVYNLSLGPVGPILDDQISRFTYASDLLTEKYNVLFCVAVGNDGESADPLNRIQSPSDMVNGLAVGAYTKIDGKIKRAPYSSIGPGREGNKLKPDITAFGGCDQTPMHLVSISSGHKLLAWGTSFSAPLVASVAAEIVGTSDGIIDPFLARLMLINSVKFNKKKHCYELGHGSVTEDIERMTSCESNSYTLIYTGELTPSTYAEFKIPWINNICEGKIKFQWTLGILADVDERRPDDYTTCGAQISFYPNSNRFKFSKKGEKKKIAIDIEKEPVKYQALIEQGWVKGNFPVSESGPVPFADEEVLRRDMKWDTVDTRSKNKQSSKIFDPIFHIHSLSRGVRDKSKKIRYGLILNVEAPKSCVDFYSRILEYYPALIPLELKAIQNVDINI